MCVCMCVCRGGADSEEGEGGTNWEIGAAVPTWPCVKEITRGKLLRGTGNSARFSVMTRGVRWGSAEREVKDGGDVCVHVADLLHCAAETNRTL